MSLGQGSIVAMTRAPGNSLTGSPGKKPLFGRIMNAAAPWSVQWENGKSTGTVIPSTGIDEIAMQVFEPAVVRLVSGSTEFSAEYDSIIVSAYTRTITGGSARLFYLLRMLTDDTFIEVPSDGVRVIER